MVPRRRSGPRRRRHLHQQHDFGRGRTVLSGAGVNNGGITLTGGEMVLAKSVADAALSGNVTINNATLRSASEQMLDSAGSITYTTTLSTATLDTDGFSETIGNLVLSASQIITDGGILTVKGNVTSTTSASSRARSPTSSDWAAARECSTSPTARPRSTSMYRPSFPTARSSSKARALRLSGANTYAGGTSVQAGSLLLENDAALGSGSVTLAGGRCSPAARRGASPTPSSPPRTASSAATSPLALPMHGTRPTSRHSQSRKRQTDTRGAAKPQHQHHLRHRRRQVCGCKPTPARAPERTSPSISAPPAAGLRSHRPSISRRWL